MALAIIAHLETEDDQQPPFDAGSLDKASPDVKERLREYARIRS